MAARDQSGTIVYTGLLKVDPPPYFDTCFRYRAESVSHVGIDASNSFEKCWQIMQEIQKNGPVVASMNVYIDFLIYKAGLNLSSIFLK
jgi:hypothetical protein